MIINPSWFYWVSVVGNLGEVVGLTAAGLIIAGGIMALNVYVFNDMHENFNEERDRKRMYRCLLIGVILAFVACLFPSKDTMYKMMIANYITKENLEWTAETVKSTVDYMIQAFNNLH